VIAAGPVLGESTDDRCWDGGELSRRGWRTRPRQCVRRRVRGLSSPRGGSP
jgi:hypothetical protein